jgi:hypothetical protein
MPMVIPRAVLVIGGVHGNRRSANAGRGFIDENGKERLSVEGKLLENLRGIGSLGAARRPARHRLVDLKLSGQAVRGVPVPTTPDGSELRFAMDSPVEGDGFEPLVPGESRGSRQVDIL